MKKLILIICLSLVSAFAFSQWKWQNPLPQGNTLTSVHFLGADTGYAVGDLGTIIKTIDGGVSWTLLTYETYNELFSVYFTNPNDGFAVGVEGTIIKTTDGGTTWTIIPSGTLNTLYSIFFPNNSNGYIVGENGIILKSIDSGSTWTEISGGGGPDNCLVSVCFTDANTGYIADNNYSGCSILKTIDSGNTWSNVFSASSGYRVRFPKPFSPPPDHRSMFCIFLKGFSNPF
jgi:photosystem II stability/assembly factor-like uncharacterized protein